MLQSTVKMLQTRLNYINDVNDYITKSRCLLNEIIDSLGWQNPLNEDHSQHNRKVICPNDVGHRIPEKSLEKHLVKCSLHKNGYDLHDQFFPPAEDLGHNVITIDERLQNDILRSGCFGDRNTISATRSIDHHQQSRPVPQTSDRLCSDFTSAERLALYDYAVKNTAFNTETLEKDLNIPFNKTEGNSKPQTLEDMLAAERDAKRRRIKYRSKKVHTNRKTQTEIIREVIQSQMEGYEEWLQHQGLLQRSTLDLVKSEPESSTNNALNTTVSKSNSKTIIRNWDDYYYHYKGNPHKKYLLILQEVRDLDRNKKSSRDGDSRKRISKDTYMKEEYYSDNKDSKRYRTECEDYRSKQRHFRDYHEKDNQYDRIDHDWNRIKKRSEKRYDDKEYVRSSRRSYENSHDKYHKSKRQHYYKEDNERRRSSRPDDSSLKDSSDADYHQHMKRRKTKKHKHKRHKSGKHKSSTNDFHKKQDKDPESGSNTSNSDSS